MERRTIFGGWALPAVLVLPQLLLTVFFFLWPAGEAIYFSLTRQDAFGIRTEFVGLENFADLFSDPRYIDSIVRTLVFCAAVTLLAMGTALLLAVFADREIAGRGVYRTLLIWPYAVAPAVAAVLWILLLHPQIGVVSHALAAVGIAWDYKLNSAQAMLVVILASAWKQVSYGKATETLVVKVYRDGVVNLDLGGSSAQSVVLMLGVVVLTTVQFRFLGRRSLS